MTSTLSAVATTSRSSKSAVAQVFDASIDASVRQYVEARKERERWQAIEETIGAQIRGAGACLRAAVCLEQRDVVPTIRINGMLDYQEVCKYSAIPSAMEDRCMEIMGDDMDRYLRREMRVQVKP